MTLLWEMKVEKAPWSVTKEVKELGVFLLSSHLLALELFGLKVPISVLNMLHRGPGRSY